MSTQHKQDLQNAIKHLVASYQTHLDAHTICNTLLELSQTYKQPPVELRCAQTSPLVFEWIFRDHETLSEQLTHIFQVGAVGLTPHEKMTPFASLTLIIKTGYEDDVSLKGDIIHISEHHAAVQLGTIPNHAQQVLGRAVQALKKGPHPALSQPPVKPTPKPQEKLEPKPVTIQQESKQTYELKSPQIQTTTQQQWQNCTLQALLLAVCRQRDAHHLTMRCNQRDVTITFYHDTIVDVEGEAMPSIESAFKQHPHINQQQLTQAKQITQDFGITLGEALLDMDLITYEEMRYTLSQRILDAIEQLWTMPITQATHAQLSQLKQRRLAAPVNIFAQIFHHTNQRYSKDTPRNQIDELSTCYQYVERDPNVLFQLQLHDKKQRLLDAISQEVHTLHDIQRITTLPKRDVLQLLHTLRDMNLVEEQVDGLRTRQVSRAHRSLETRIHENAIQNDFEILGVHWSAYDEDIEEGYQAKLREFSRPEYINQPKLVAQIRDTLNKAYEHLKYRPNRDAHRRKMVDEYTLRTSLDLYIKRADAAQLKHDYECMEDCYLRVLELEPQRPNIKHLLESTRHAIKTRSQDQAARRAQIKQIVATTSGYPD